MDTTTSGGTLPPSQKAKSGQICRDP